MKEPRPPHRNGPGLRGSHLMEQNTSAQRKQLTFRATCSTCRSAGATAYWPADQAGLQQARFTCARCRTLQLELSRNLNAALSRWADTWTAKGLHARSEEHTSELQSRGHLVCRLLLEK